MDLKNGQAVQIHLTTQVEQDGQHANFVFDLPGQLVKLGSTLYLRYIEVAEDGTEQPVTIKHNADGGVQIMRGKDLRTRLQFVYQEAVASAYATPYGAVEVTTLTNALHFSLKDQPVSGSLNLAYDLFSGEQLMGHYRLALEFTALA